jgi:hypothetical protein
MVAVVTPTSAPRLLKFALPSIYQLSPRQSKSAQKPLENPLQTLRLVISLGPADHKMSWETSAEDSSELRNATRDCPGLRQLFLRRSRLTATHESYFYIRFVLYLSLLSPSIVCHLHSIPARCIPKTLVHQPHLPSPVVLPLASKH